MQPKITIRTIVLLTLSLCLNNCGVNEKNYIKLEKTEFSQLQGWQIDNHQEALATFNKSCKHAKSKLNVQIFASVPNYTLKNEWDKICKLSSKQQSKNHGAKSFFEKNFVPYLVSDKKGAKGLFTGYYEVTIEGSATKTSKHKHPIYLHSKVHNLKLPRSKIEKGALKNKNLEIAYVADKVGLFFMHIQGSGKIKLSPNTYIKLGYAGQNGYEYYAIGNYLTQNNLIDKNSASAESIIKWLHDNPKEADKVMHLNESYVFFKQRKEHDPVGAMGIEVTPMRSLAVDRKFIPLGIPLWLETTYPRYSKSDPDKAFNRIMIAQDVGGAIKGAVRGDIFFGSSRQAEKYAWYMKNKGKYFILVPKEIAKYMPQ